LLIESFPDREWQHRYRRVYVPELPEVETVRAGLAPALTGHFISEIVPGDFPGVLGSISLGEATSRMTLREISDVRRRGKFLIISFIDGDGIIAHLRMTGTLTLEPADMPVSRFHRLTLVLDDGNQLRFADQRKFGRIEAASATEISALDHRLGPEPLSEQLSPAYLLERLQRRSAPIKSLLLDQRTVAGLGNIYVDEALFQSRIHPLRSGGSLTSVEIERLHQNIVCILVAAIEHRGTTFSSFRSAYGEIGENQHHLVVYGRGRNGQPCVDCGAALQRIVVGGRGTNFCPCCQLLASGDRGGR
jgi:formamidopyrimidine-DNA glycosylase